MGKKLLVADDSVTIQKVIKLALSSEGYDILAVSDGREAIRAIQEERPDVVLIDIALPGADAYAVKKAINSDPQLASVGFILLASAFERVDESMVSEAGFQGRLIKPFDPSHLRKAVSELMSKIALGGVNSAPPPAPPVVEVEDDLPPVVDMHPTVAEDEYSNEQITTELTPPTIIIPSPSVSSFEIETTKTGLIQPKAPPPPPPQISEEADEVAATRALENDIKDLTESTIKLSGLDEFQWNLDDTKKMKAPGAPPIDRTREIARPTPKEGGFKNIITIPSKPIDDGGSNFPLKQPPAAHAAPATASLTRSEIEDIVRKDVQATLERVLRDLVPQMAESIIRKEIDKILSES
jgi:CheY-like chemotaxis protein